MTQIYHIPNFYAMSEEDIYNEGCQPDGTQYIYEQSFDAASEADLIEKIMKHFDVERDAIELNACEEYGRIDVSRMETVDGCKASEQDLADWKHKEIRLYYVVYSGKLEIKQPGKFTI